MAVFPIVVDSRPEYLSESSALSLLQLPCGYGTVLSHIARVIEPLTNHQLTIVRNFEVDAVSYDRTVRQNGVSIECIVPASGFQARLATYEPSDCLLIVEPLCLPIDGLVPSQLVGDFDETPRLVRHLIALDTSAAGTNERVEFDVEGRPRRVRRYYDSVTWTMTKAVACSLLPVSALAIVRPLNSISLMRLRQELAAHGVPAIDVPVTGPVADLSKQQGLLALNERLLKDVDVFDRRHPATVPDRVRIHSSARIVGRVVLQPGAEIGEDVLVIGPAVIGEGARLETGAIVAQSVVARDVTIPARAAVRHRVVTTSALPPLPSAEPESVTIGEHIDLWEEKKAGTAYPAVKRAIETLVAMVALALLSPLLMLVSALVKLDSRGPIFYGDPREGKGGKPFPCFKFRTMIVGAHAAQRSLLAANQVDGPQFKMAADPRVTRLGRWLRLANIDELPQLINVVMGQMSLVGPRPSPFRENQTCVPWREARLSVRPGITGLWQVCRHERELGDFHQWIYYDIQYVRHMSPIVDLKIIVATVLVMLGIRKYFPLTWIIAPDPQEVALSQSIASATRVS